MTRIALIGAGSAVFAADIIRHLLSQTALGDSLEIVLHDTDAERLTVSYSLALRLAANSRSLTKIIATPDLDEAIADADFVAVMILVGGFDAIQRDFEVPLAYGIHQTVGDTHGIGGMSRFIRTVPALRAIAESVMRNAPDALVLWYTNPLAMNLWALYRLGLTRVVGLCRDVLKTAFYISQYLEIPFSDLQYQAAGINHMCWFLKLWNSNGDLYPRLRTAMALPEIHRQDPVRFDLMRRFGFFVSESSTHLAEYLPYFSRTEALRLKYDVQVGYYLTRYQQDASFYETTVKPMARGDVEMQFAELRDEIGQHIISAIATGSSYKFNGNILNESRISNLPRDCVVEVPCEIRGKDVIGTGPGPIPEQLVGLTAPHVMVQRLTVDSIFRGDMDSLYQACFLDPLLSSQLSLDEIVSLCNDLCDAQGYDLSRLRYALGESI